MKRFFVLVVLAVVFFSCKAAKHIATHEPQPGENEKIAFRIDSISANLDLEPASGHSMVLQSVQVYIVTKIQPNVRFSIKPKDDVEATYKLPQFSNDETYSFGGGSDYHLSPGDKAHIAITQGYPNPKPLVSRIIISGYQQKIKKE